MSLAGRAGRELVTLAISCAATLAGAVRNARAAYRVRARCGGVVCEPLGRVAPRILRARARSRPNARRDDIRVATSKESWSSALRTHHAGPRVECVSMTLGERDRLTMRAKKKS